MRALRIVANLFQQKDALKVKKNTVEDPKLRLSLLKCSFSHGCLTDLLQDSTVSQHTMGIFDRDYITPQGSLLYFKKVKKKGNSQPCPFYSV